MRGTEGYTGRYVWELSVLFELRRRRRGLQPLAYTEKTLFCIWPLEFVRHILEVHLHQTGSGTNSHRPSCLEWLTMSRVPEAPKCTCNLPDNSPQVPGSCVRAQMGIPALPQPKYTVRTQVEANSLPPETCLVEDLAPICRKTHFCPSPFTLSWCVSLIIPMGAFGTEWESTWNEWSWYTSMNSHCFIWGQ